jgi:hypothetical protein
VNTKTPKKERAKRIDGKTIDRDKVLDAIYGEVAKGNSLLKVLSADGMPDYTSFMRWQREDETIRNSLACAREEGVECHLDTIIEISDDRTDDPASRRVRIDARIKAAQMMGNRKYHPRLDLKHDGSVDTTVTVAERSISDIATWIAGAVGK